MAIENFLKLADKSLAEVFAKKPYDPTKARAAMIKRLDTAAEQFASATPVKGRKMFKIANGVVELTTPFAINGETVFTLPSERFADALKALKASINAGELDEALKGEDAATTTNKLGIETKKTRAGWSPERHAAAAAKKAAREAAKAKAAK